MGRSGTLARVLVGSGLIVLATVVWRADWLDFMIGLVALPAVATLLMWLRDRSARTGCESATIRSAARCSRPSTRSTQQV